MSCFMAALSDDNNTCKRLVVSQLRRQGSVLPVCHWTYVYKSVHTQSIWISGYRIVLDFIYSSRYLWQRQCLMTYTTVWQVGAGAPASFLSRFRSRQEPTYTSHGTPVAPPPWWSASRSCFKSMYKNMTYFGMQNQATDLCTCLEWSVISRFIFIPPWGEGLPLCDNTYTCALFVGPLFLIWFNFGYHFHQFALFQVSFLAFQFNFVSSY